MSHHLFGVFVTELVGLVNDGEYQYRSDLRVIDSRRPVGPIGMVPSELSVISTPLRVSEREFLLWAHPDG